MPVQRLPCNTSHFEIFNYWKNKCIDQYGNVFINGSASYGKTEQVVYDWGEPCCWACDSGTYVWECEEYDSLLHEEDLSKLYSHKKVKSHLERCHIVARSHGGKDEPENLFLLCPKCHKESPHIKNKQLFLAWVFKKRRSPSEAVQIATAIKDVTSQLYGIREPYIRRKDLDKAIANGEIAVHPGSSEFESKVWLCVNIAVQNATELDEEHEIMYREFLERKIAELTEAYPESAEINAYKTCLVAYEMYKTIEREGIVTGQN